MKRNNKKGFTLVELVIVIAVIAILSAILIPTFGNIIEDANKTSAQSDTKAAVTTHMSVVAKDGGNLADGYIVMLEDGAAKYYFVYENGNLGEASKEAPDGCDEYTTATASTWTGLVTGEDTTKADGYARSTEFLYLKKAGN